MAEEMQQDVQMQHASIAAQHRSLIHPAAAASPGHGLCQHASQLRVLVESVTHLAQDARSWAGGTSSWMEVAVHAPPRRCVAAAATVSLRRSSSGIINAAKRRRCTASGQRGCCLPSSCQTASNQQCVRLMPAPAGKRIAGRHAASANCRLPRRRCTPCSSPQPHATNHSTPPNRSPPSHRATITVPRTTSRRSVVVRAEEAAAPAAPKKAEVGPKRGSTVRHQNTGLCVLAAFACCGGCASPQRGTIFA